MLLNDKNPISIQSLSLTPLVVTTTTKHMVDRAASFVELNNSSSGITLTIDSPKPGWLLVITQKDSGIAGHTVTLTSGTFDGSATHATLNSLNETIVLLGVSATRFVIVENIGAVGLS